MALLMLCYCCTTATATLLLDDATIQYSFALCKIDARCAASFQLIYTPSSTAPADSYEYANFGEMLARSLQQRFDSGTSIVPVVQGCSDGGTTDALTCQSAVQVLWLAMLREVRLCDSSNEEWVLGHGCHCSQGKHCSSHVECTYAVAADLWSLIVTVCIVGVGWALSSLWQVRHIMRLDRHVKERLHTAAANYYTSQAILYTSKLSQQQQQRGGGAQSMPSPQQQQLQQRISLHDISLV